MKANKYTIFTCIIIGVISFGFMFTIKDSSSKKFSIVVGIFTGVLISLVSALVMYFDKREDIYQAVKVNIADIFINLNLIHNMTGIILGQVQYFNNLKDLDYKRLMGLSQLNTNIVAQMQMSAFDPIFPIGKKYDAIKCMKELDDDLFELKLCIGKIQNMTLEHDYLLINIANRQHSPEEDSRLNELRTVVLIQTAKVHEDQASLLKKIDKVAAPFYEKNNTSWDSLKKQLFIKADMIMRQV